MLTVIALSVAPLMRFHTAHKLTLMAHSPKHYTEMGRLVADPGKRDWDELTAEYGAILVEGLSVMGCKRSDRGQACQRTPAPAEYRLLAVLGFLKNHLNRYPVPEWVQLQVYLHPYPKELMLRNHV